MILASDGRFSIELLSPEKFMQFWPQIEGMLDLVPHTWEDLTKESIYYRGANRGLQVWAVAEDETAKMVLFTQVATFPTGDNLEIIWCGGQGGFHKVAGDVVDAGIEKFAKMSLCKRIDVIGRFGWEAELKDRGFKRTAVVLSRRVVHRGMQ